MRPSMFIVSWGQGCWSLCTKLVFAMSFNFREFGFSGKQRYRLFTVGCKLNLACGLI